MNLTFSDKPANNRGMVLLAPTLCAVPEAFKNAGVDVHRHEQLLTELQQLRGALYLEDGAISADQLTSDGRHKLAIDERSWHVLTLDGDGKVSGCSRYSPYPENVSFRDLGVAKSAMAASPTWGKLLHAAIDAEVSLARSLNIGFGEVGGWALGREMRFTLEALRIALGSYGLAGFLGEAIVVSTVTVRNCSASILKRLGGSPMHSSGFPLPRYHEPKYNCEMEILRFDSRYPADRFRQWINAIRLQMIDVPVICSHFGYPTTAPRPAEVLPRAWRHPSVARASAA